VGQIRPWSSIGVDGSTCGSSQAPRRGRRTRQAKRNNFADKLTVEARPSPTKIKKVAAVEGERRMVEADRGPVKYLATPAREADEVVLRWFFLVVALLLDPVAVLLLLPAASARR